MYKNLNAGAIGIRGLPLEDVLALAKKVGFEGIDFSIREAAALADEHDVQYVRDLFDSFNVRPAQWGLPVIKLRLWSEEQWQEDMEELPELAALGQALGCTRTTSPCPPGADREYEEQFDWAVSKYRSIAEILLDYGCRLGLEFVGPKRSRARYSHAFAYNLERTMELAEAVGTGNVGVLLDAWHLYTSGGSVEDVGAITAEDIVAVHVNDAPRGLTLEEQDDHNRHLPMETGVIDLPGLMRKLDEMGYDGPVTPEPFSASLNALASRDPLKAAQLAKDSMDRMWQASGLA
jgi:sugar phosphate isomerase/epimerase